MGLDHVVGVMEALVQHCRDVFVVGHVDNAIAVASLPYQACQAQLGKVL